MNNMCKKCYSPIIKNFNVAKSHVEGYNYIITKQGHGYNFRKKTGKILIKVPKAIGTKCGVLLALYLVRNWKYGTMFFV
jgi:hypothetical protein